MSIEAFEAGIHALRIEKPEAAAWLLNVEPAKWARCAFPGRRWGHDTSNIVESMNGALKEHRTRPILDLLDAIWHKVMSTCADRFALAQSLVAKAATKTPYLTGLLREQDKWSQQNNALPSSKLVVRF